MSQKYSVPNYFKYGDYNLRADNYKDEYFDEVFQLFQEGKKDSAGIHFMFILILITINCCFIIYIFL